MDAISRIQNTARMRLEHQTRISVAQKENIQAGKGRTEVAAFQSLLEQKLNQKEGVRFSKHAAERMEERGMEMTDGLLNSLNDAVHRAGEKGAKETLIVGRNGMYIVNVPNKVVVTAVRRDEMKENIFTNIDSAVWM